jgi:hypothetical protein
MGVEGADGPLLLGTEAGSVSAAAGETLALASKLNNSSLSTTPAVLMPRLPNSSLISLMLDV